MKRGVSILAATAAAIATLKKLASPKADVYSHVGKLGQMLEDGLKRIFKEFDAPVCVAREGSAFCVYFMDHAPRDYHDIAQHNNASLDKAYRLKLIEKGIFNFPLPIKQGSISFAHSAADIEQTLTKTEGVCRDLLRKAGATPAARELSRQSA